MDAPLTIQAALVHGAQQLPLSDAPQLDAEYLLLHAAGQKQRTWLYAHATEALSSSQYQHYDDLLQKRREGFPLAYLIGSWEFYGREFAITPDVLIPRPATEALVEKALQVITDLRRKEDRPLIIADVGCGSGCIAITLALETSAITVAHFVATDISSVALKVAQENAKRHGVESRLTFLEGDMLAPLQERAIDLVVSNPPYVPSAELRSAQQSSLPETRGLIFEPQAALDGGSNGKHFIKQITTSGIPAVVETVGGRIAVF